MVIYIQIYDKNYINIETTTEFEIGDETIVSRSTINFYKDAAGDYTWIIDQSDSPFLYLEDIHAHADNILNLLRNHLTLYFLKEATGILRVSLTSAEMDAIGLVIGKSPKKRSDAVIGVDI